MKMSGKEKEGEVADKGLLKKKGMGGRGGYI